MEAGAGAEDEISPKMACCHAQGPAAPQAVRATGEPQRRVAGEGGSVGYTGAGRGRFDQDGC